jgi:aspartate racemase
MEQAFYRGRLAERYGLEVLVPHTADRDLVHRVIYEELCQGRVEPGSKAEYLRIVASLAARGAEVVILGCTEIGMLIGQRDTEVRLLDTTLIHAQKAVELATV